MSDATEAEPNRKAPIDAIRAILVESTARFSLTKKCGIAFRVWNLSLLEA